MVCKFSDPMTVSLRFFFQKSADHYKSSVFRSRAKRIMAEKNKNSSVDLGISYRDIVVRIDLRLTINPPGVVKGKKIFLSGMFFLITSEQIIPP